MYPIQKQRYKNKEWVNTVYIRVVLFFPFCCCFTLSTVTQTKLFHSISEMFFNFLTRKNSLRKTFLLECVRSGAQQAAKKAGILARNSHTPVASDLTYHFSHMRKNVTSSGAPNDNFRKISVRKTICDLEFSEHLFKISCLPASPRIFEHLKNGIIAHF